MTVALRRRSMSVMLKIVLALAVSGRLSAHASLTVLVGEPFGNFGTMMPLGHTAIYLDHVCADGPLHVRICGEHDVPGVVLARYYAIGRFDWMATPVRDFLYATETPSEILQYATPETVWAMRERYRQRFLREVVPDGTEGELGSDGGATGSHNLEEWWESAGMAYQRQVWGYQVDTTLEQDARLVERMNTDANRHRYHLNGENCADFVAHLVNFYYPGSIRRADRVADFALMTPKHVARSLSEYAARHEDLNLKVWQIAQVPGSLRRSRPVWGSAEAALKTKRYLFTLLVIQPEIPLALEALYLIHGRWKVGNGAQPMPGVPQTPPVENASVSATPPAGAAAQVQ